MKYYTKEKKLLLDRDYINNKCNYHKFRLKMIMH